MTLESTITNVKKELNITASDTHDQLITDMYNLFTEYTNQTELPDALEPVLRQKVSDVINYEVKFGADNVTDLKAQTAGDCSWTYADTMKRSNIYGLSNVDKSRLKVYRRTRR